MSVGPTIVTDTAAAPVSFEWQRWAALSLLRGTAVSAVIETLVANGTSPVDAAQCAARLMVDPALEAGKWVLGQLHKANSLLEIREQLADLAEPSRDVPRRSGLTSEEFLTCFYAANRPVLLEDVCDGWPARELWSSEYLVDRLGSAEVEVMQSRGPGPGDELHMDEQRTRVAFADYAARVREIEWSNELYLVANNGLLASEAADALWRDFHLDERYLDPNAHRSGTFIWYGPAGTITNLHHDTMNILFHQVYGWKHVILVPPTATHKVANSIGVYSDVDPLAPDLDRYPLYAEVRPRHVTVGPGEALFIPVGWWHHVTGLETSISISSTSFRYPNRYNWAHPSMVL